jgi:hypothetical protein
MLDPAGQPVMSFSSDGIETKLLSAPGGVVDPVVQPDNKILVVTGSASPVLARFNTNGLLNTELSASRAGPATITAVQETVTCSLVSCVRFAVLGTGAPLFARPASLSGARSNCGVGATAELSGRGWGCATTTRSSPAASRSVACARRRKCNKRHSPPPSLPHRHDGFWGFSMALAAGA